MRKLAAILFVFFIASIANAAIVASTATGTSFTASANVTSFTLNRPSSVNVGDLLFVQVTVNGNINITAPSGWTSLDDDFNNSVRQLIFYRVATSTDTANGATTWTVASGTRVVASMTGYRSDLSGRTVVLGTETSTTGNSATMTAPAMTATAPGRLLRFYGQATTNTLTSSTLTAHVSAHADTSVTLFAGSRAIANAGTTTTDIITASSSGRFVIHSVLLTESTPTKPTTCYTDNFSSTTTFGQNWVTTTVGTNAFTPSIVGGRLRLTDTIGYEATGATLQRLFPTSNLIYVEFNHYAYNGSGADGIAVTLSDATITPQPGGFGGSLGYAQRNDSGGINGFAGGWMGIALDEYGNYSNPTEGRNGGPGSVVDAVAIRGSGSGQTGYPYVAGTATLTPGIDNSASTSAAPGYRYRIVIDAAAAGQTYVTVDRDTTGAGTSYTNLIPTFNIQSSSGQASIPANLMLTLTGSSGGSTNIHEIGNLSVCASTINTSVQVDHFEFTYPTQALTCEPANVTVKACADAACSTLMAVPVALTMSPSASASFVGGNTVTFTGSTTLQLRQTTAGNAMFSVGSSSPGAKPFSTNKCNGTSSNTCTEPFVDTGLLFDVPNGLANKPSGSVRIRAVRTDNSTNACTSLIPANSTQNISFWFNYVNPTTANASTPRVVELRSVNPVGSFQNLSTTAASTSVPLYFQTDASGDISANFETRYSDAGQMQLLARFTDASSGVVLNGSDTFVSYPAGFCIRAPVPSSSPQSYYNCTSNFANCAVITKAGNPFTLNIAAVAWENDTDSDFCTNNLATQNYQQSALGLSSQFGLTPAQFGVATGGANGVVSPTSVAITTNGAVTPSNVTESEVGAFTFTVTPPTGAYFGVTVPPGTSQITGRFTPDHFSVSGSPSLINRSTSCAVAPAFTYIGETLNLNYQLNALNLSNVITQNYQSIFAKLSTFTQMNTAAIATSPRTLLTPVSSATAGNPFSAIWTNGQGNVTSPVAITKTAAALGPYLSTAFGVKPTDSDNVTTTGLNLDTDVPAVTPVVYDLVQIGSNTDLRYGRLRLDSVSGPSNMSLSIPVTVEYWNGAGFVVNSADSNCTTVNSNSAIFGTYRGNLSNGETTKSGSAAIINGQTLSALQLSAPGAGNEGSVDLILDTSAWPWLWFDWNGDGSLDTTATATASFGTYRGSDRVIYWLETQ